MMIPCCLLVCALLPPPPLAWRHVSPWRSTPGRSSRKHGLSCCLLIPPDKPQALVGLRPQGVEPHRVLSGLHEQCAVPVIAPSFTSERSFCDHGQTSTSRHGEPTCSLSAAARWAGSLRASARRSSLSSSVRNLASSSRLLGDLNTPLSRSCKNFRSIQGSRRGLTSRQNSGFTMAAARYQAPLPPVAY